MGQSWDLDPKTGDYIMVGGEPQNTDKLLVPMYIRLKTKRNGWLYAPDTLFGSDLSLLKKRKSSGDASQVEATVSRAIQPIVDDGRATTIEVTANFASRNAVGLDAIATDARGNVEKVKIESLGV